jgi:nitroimidazol reductase NimA-like FMN-containing flavoprotein (pyridoxamine 5'-phosphate oxidase superfamily)
MDIGKDHGNQSQGDSDDNTLSVTERIRLRRYPERGHTDRAVLNAILDQGWIVHVGFVADAGQPFVIPTTYVRIDRSLYLHGAVANHMLRTGASGVDLCATVTLLDGLVVARSALHHSMNYRSAVIFGRARVVEDDTQKRRVLAALVERFIPGRSQVARPPSPQELKRTLVLELPLEEASVKIRSGPPAAELEEDLAWPVWSGIIPLTLASGAPQPVQGAVGTAPAQTLAGPTQVTEKAATAPR